MNNLDGQLEFLVPLTRSEWRRVGDLVIELHDTLMRYEQGGTGLDVKRVLRWLDNFVNEVEGRLAGKDEEQQTYLSTTSF